MTFLREAVVETDEQFTNGNGRDERGGREVGGDGCLIEIPGAAGQTQTKHDHTELGTENRGHRGIETSKIIKNSVHLAGIDGTQCDLLFSFTGDVGLYLLMTKLEDNIYNKSLTDGYESCF